MIETIYNSRAVVTGAASGIGRALVEALLNAGAHVVAVDIDGASLERFRANEKMANRLHVFSVDVSDASAMETARVFAESVIGGVDLLFNNAGVAYNVKPLWEISPEMVDWSYGVNVFGVINGIRSFVPTMIAQGNGHIVNTSSIGGFQVSERFDIWHQGLYASTKYAVVALSEALAMELAPRGIGVSVLAPSGVATGIAKSDRNRPERFGGPGSGSSSIAMAEMIEAGSDPAAVADITLDAVLNNRLYVFTDGDFRERLRQRAQRIDQAFDEVIKLLHRQKSISS